MTDTPMGGASVSEVLAAAADLLEKPGAWTQFGGFFDPANEDANTGRDESGNGVDGASADAVCWCIFGAIEKVECGLRLPTTGVLEQALGKTSQQIVDWNDAPGRTQAEVVTALRDAARQASNPTAEGK